MPGLGRGQRNNNRGGGSGNQWRPNTQSFNQNKGPQPLLQTQILPPTGNQYSTQMNQQQQFRQQQPSLYMQQQTQQQQQSFHQQSFQNQGQGQGVAGGGAFNQNVFRPNNNPFIQNQGQITSVGQMHGQGQGASMQGQLPSAQMQIFNQVQQQQTFGAQANMTPLLNQQNFQQVNQQPMQQQSFMQQNYTAQQLQQNYQQQQQQQTLAQQKQQTFPLVQSGLTQQQQLAQQALAYAQQQQQQQPLQQSYAQQHQQQQPQQQSYNQWQQWNNPAAQVTPTATLPSYPSPVFADAMKPPLPPTPVAPPPPVSIINPPLPPPEPQPEKHEVGKIRSTNLQGLMEIIAGKNKDNESKIPGLDLEAVSSPKPKPSEESRANAAENETAIRGIGPVGAQVQADPNAAVPPVAPISTVSATATTKTESQVPPGSATVTSASAPAPGAPSDTSELHKSASDGTAVVAPIGVSRAEIVTSSTSGDDGVAGGSASQKEALKAFDKKFREWEKQFEDWKKASSGHPDRVAYGKYLAQWESMRDQLVQQRRFIIANINKDRGDVTPTNSSGASAINPVALKNWNSEQPVTDPAVNAEFTPANGGNSNSGQATSFHNQGNLQFPPKQPEVPKPAPPAAHDPYETRDLSKLIQNPFAVTGGPISSEQRQFIQPLAKAQAPPSLLGRDPSSAVSSSAHGFQSAVMPKIPSLLEPSIQQSSGRPPSPTERVSRQFRDRNDFNQFDSSDSSFEQHDFSANSRIGQNSSQQNFQSKNPFDQSVNPFDLPPKGLASTQQNLGRQPLQQGFFRDREETAQRNLPGGNTFPNSQYSGQYASSDSFNRAPSADLNNKSSFDQKAGVGGRDSFEFNRREPAAAAVVAPFQESDFEFSRRSDTEKRAKLDTSQPVTFDYGHGSNPIAEEALFSRNRDYEVPEFTRRPAVSGANESETVTTFDYGHGTASPVPVTAEALKEPVVDEELESYHDRYQDPQEEIFEEEYYESPPPFHADHPGFGEWGPPVRGGPGGRGMFMGRGMPPRMRGGFPGPHFRPPFPHPGMYYDEFGYGPPGPRFPRFRGPGPQFYGPPDGYYPPHPGPHGPPGGRPPLFPITEFDRPSRIAPPSEPDTSAPRSPELRQAPPRDGDLEPISPEGSPKGSSSGNGVLRDRGRDRDRGKIRRGSRDRSISRGRDRSSDRIRRHPTDRSSRERDLSPFSRRKRDLSPRLSRRGRSRSRSRSPRRRERERRSRTPDRRASASGRRSSPSRPVLIEEILNNPGRKKRPSQIVIILRGLPGSGKTHVAKLIKDRETEFGDGAPRILSLDDYFMTGEEKKTVKDPVTGKETKESITTYEYDVDLENGYRNDLFKTFRKTIEAGYFRFIIVDCINDKFKYYQEMTNFAKAKRFTVYIVEMEGNAEDCAKKNIHNRTLAEIKEIEKNWERTSAQFTKLDVRNLLQDTASHHVEMEDVSDSDEIFDNEPGGSAAAFAAPVEVIELEDEDEPWATSKWETSEDKLNKLDGLKRKRKNADSDDEENAPQSMEQWLQTHVPEDYSYRRDTQPGKKRVRWADIEARREQERSREIGFVVGHTNWSQVGKDASSALTKTKYI